MMSRLLAFKLIGITILGIWPLLLKFATIFPLMVITISHLLSFGFVGLLMPEVYQSFGMHDGFINGSKLSVFQLYLGQILLPINEVEQHITICEVRNLKCDGGKILYVHPNIACLLQFPKLVFDLIYGIVKKQGFLKFLAKLLPRVDGASTLSYLNFLTHPP